MENLNLKLEMFVVCIAVWQSGVYCIEAGDKVSNDCRNRCGSIVQTENVYVSQATLTATRQQAVLVTKVRSVTVTGISSYHRYFSYFPSPPTPHINTN